MPEKVVLATSTSLCCTVIIDSLLPEKVLSEISIIPQYAAIID